MEHLATLVLKNVDFKAEGDCFGCETGTLAIIDKNLPLQCALGDFDSISAADLKRIKEKALSIETYSSHKDFSDSELAVDYLVQKGYQNINVYGGLGGRTDHQHINFLLALKYPQVKFIDAIQELYSLSVGEHLIEKGNYDVFSIFSFKKAQISIEDCEYPLSKKDIDIDNTLTLSNAWISDYARLTIHAGKCLIIKCKNR